ncbi:nicotinate mononucleotide-dependent phosphoribosyltransferase CobT [Acidianus sp. HS-5]|uniref:nicotinate mononucleotide-dependent phosphoribosyltransferase CobT n=1 Tax=Acidianus sp. HS-5 TaxID=2886040 RepID=UPI001F4591B9|nr:TIGR00303 family protein [Acidianus sp. HS-5]BDC18340.1 TIGR00303 family protein [Acidianus sp. HS-5]
MIKEVLGSFAENLKTAKNYSFILVIATTDVSLIPGITVAGASPELTHFTPAADSEFLLLGKCKVINTVPITPDGIPTPALVSRASLSFTKVSKLVVNAGSKILPKIPYIDIGGKPGGDIRKYSLDLETAERILENSTILGEEFSNSFDLLVIGESIPAGTTTAMAVLQGLGYDAIDKVSSASPSNPKELKKKIVLDALRDLPKDSLRKIAKLADPMLISVAGISLGFKGKILLAGGTQMTAAAGIIKEFNKEKLKDVAIGTTKWIVNDKCSDIVALAKQVGINLIYADLDFSISKHPGIRVYEKGYVKEGVGAGGASILAMNNGAKNEDIVKKVDEMYSELLISKS